MEPKPDDTPRVLAIGLDSADRNLIDRWIDDGALPALGSLRANGVWGPLSPPPGLGNNAAWPSLFTGAPPDVHGHYTYRTIEPRSYRVGTFEPEDYRCRPFWEALGRAGRRVAIIDVPKAPLSRDLNGVQVADWALHDPIYRTPCSSPPEWIDEVHERFGVDPVRVCDGHDGESQTLLNLRDDLLERIDRKTRLVLEVLARGDADLVFTAFADSHCAGHQLWHVHDPAHPAHDPGERQRSGDLLRDVYVALDAAVGRLCAAAGEGTRVLIFSALGVGPNYTGHDLLDEALRRFEKSPQTAGGRLHDLARIARHWIPLRVRRYVGPWVKDRFEDALLTRDRASRSCFVEPHNDVLAGIRINLEGREPAGRVAPGAAYEDVCRRIENQLGSLVNVDTGAPAVKSVVRVRDLYPRAPEGELPDLFVEWNKEAPIERLGGPGIGVVTRERPRHRSGDHTVNGFFLAGGPDLSRRDAEGVASVCDVAPTLAAWLGVSLANVDSAPLPSLAAASVHDHT